MENKIPNNIQEFNLQYPNFIEKIIEENNFSTGSLNETYIIEAGRQAIEYAFNKGKKNFTSYPAFENYITKIVKDRILKAIENKQEKDREFFINNFIKPTFNKVEKFINKEDFISYSIEINNLGILVRNILEKYQIKYSQPEMLVYDKPFHVSFIIDMPFVIMDIGYKKNEENLIEYEIRIVNLETEIKRQYNTTNFDYFKKYIIGYLSSYTQLYEIIKNFKSMDNSKNSSI